MHIQRDSRKKCKSIIGENYAHSVLKMLRVRQYGVMDKTAENVVKKANDHFIKQHDQRR